MKTATGYKAGQGVRYLLAEAKKREDRADALQPNDQSLALHARLMAECEALRERAKRLMFSNNRVSGR